MTYLLDTSILIELLRTRPDAMTWLTKSLKDTILVSTVCEAEVYEGIYREKPENIEKKKKIFKELLSKLSGSTPFDSDQADIAGQIRAQLAIKGSPIGDLDVLIAAAAIANSATLVTLNPNHFSKIQGLKVEGI